jgi:hypothetical protein
MSALSLSITAADVFHSGAALTLGELLSDIPNQHAAILGCGVQTFVAGKPQACYAMGVVIQHQLLVASDGVPQNDIVIMTTTGKRFSVRRECQRKDAVIVPNHSMQQTAIEVEHADFSVGRAGENRLATLVDHKASNQSVMNLPFSKNFAIGKPPPLYLAIDTAA